MTQRLLPAAEERPPFLLRGLGAALLLTLAVVVAEGWMIGLELQLDDFEQIHDAAHPGRPGVLLGGDSEASTALRAHPSFVRFFRPVLWADFALEVAIFGARPGWLHATSLLWHLAVCLLLRRVLVRLLPLHRPERAALLASLVFAVHPGKWSAISWVAARGDVLIAFFFLVALLALIRFRERGRRRDLVATYVATLVALGSKEAGIACPVLLGILDLVLLRRFGAGVGWKRSTMVSAPLVLLAPLCLLARRIAFGAEAEVYAGRARIFSWGVVERMVGDLWPTFHRHLGGWFYFDEGGVLFFPGGLLLAAQHAAALLLIVLLGIWALRRPVLRGSFLGVLTLCWLIAALPALRFYEEARGYDVSRLFYLPGLFAAVATTLPLTWLFGRGRLMKILGRVWLVVLVAVVLPAVLAHVRAQTAAADLIERVRRELGAVADATPGNDTAYALLDLPTGIDHAPTYGTFLTFAFGDVFLERPILAASVINLEVFLGSGQLRDVKRPVRVLRWNEDAADGGRLETVTPLLPAPRGWTPRIELPPQASEVAFAEILAPRDVQVIGVAFDRAPESAFRLQLVFDDVVGGSVAFDVDWEPALYGSAGRALIPVMSDRAWLFSPGLRRARILGTEGAPRVVALDFGAALPAIELIAPDGHRVPSDGPEPAFTFRDPHGFAWLRVGFFVGGEIRYWTLRRSELEAGSDGTLTFRMSQPGFVRSPPEHREDPFYWDQLKRADGSDALTHLGVAELALEWWVEGLTGQVLPDRGARAQARSPNGRVVIVHGEG